MVLLTLVLACGPKGSNDAEAAEPQLVAYEEVVEQCEGGSDTQWVKVGRTALAVQVLLCEPGTWSCEQTPATIYDGEIAAPCGSSDVRVSWIDTE